jgi:hypothetical protein
MKARELSNLTIKLVVLLTVVFSTVAYSQPNQTPNSVNSGNNKTIGRAVSAADIQQLFQTPPDDSRIMMRWWWFGPFASHKEIERELRVMKAAGIGGFELAVVYPMILDDSARGIKNDRYLSPEFLEKVKFTSQKAREMGLRMDVTIGSGWSYGGPYITQDLAAARLRSDSFEIAPSKTTVTRPTPYEGEKLIAAFVGRGAKNENPNTFKEIDISGTNQTLTIPPGDGPRTLVFYFSSHTGQIVKRAAIGAEGYVQDHYSRAATETHLRENGDKFMGAVEPGSVYSIFTDSLEVYGADWTSDLLEEFKKRRGYDLRPVLPLLEYDDIERSDLLRRDFGKTLTELYQERFLIPMHDWAAKNKVLFRMQNYGNPPASLSSHRYVDIYDGEGWNWRTLATTRWASSASHLFGKPVTSSETWTWIHSPGYRATPLDIKAEADSHFLAGINQLIGHGFPYSPPEAGQTGWMLYASGILNDKNPWWPVMPDLSSYLQRVSFLMRQGEPVADVALYAPTDDAWALFKPGSTRYLNLWAKISDVIGPNVIPAILDSGHNFDLIDDGTLKEAQNRRYKVIVLPGVRFMPEETKKWLADYVKGGGKVIAVRRQPEGSTSFEVTTENDLSNKLKNSAPADFSTNSAVPEIGYVHRRLTDSDIYFVANTGNVQRNISASFGSKLPNAELWNPMTGKAEALQTQNGKIVLNLEPYASRIVVFRKDAGSASQSKARSAGALEDLGTGWTLKIGENLNNNTVNLPYSWEKDAATRYFSGTATYTRSVQLKPAFREQGARVFLDFGEAKPIEKQPLPSGTLRGNSFEALVAPPIREAATVFVNGKRAGSIWSAPYKVDITDFLNDGSNEIKLEVYNTGINRLSEGGKLPDMNALVERYGLRARLQDYEGLQPLPSGIMSSPRIIVEK